MAEKLSQVRYHTPTTSFGVISSDLGHEGLSGICNKGQQRVTLSISEYLFIPVWSEQHWQRTIGNTHTLFCSLNNLYSSKHTGIRGFEATEGI